MTMIMILSHEGPVVRPATTRLHTLYVMSQITCIIVAACLLTTATDAFSSDLQQQEPHQGVLHQAEAGSLQNSTRTTIICRNNETNFKNETPREYEMRREQEAKCIRQATKSLLGGRHHDGSSRLTRTTKLRDSRKSLGGVDSTRRSNDDVDEQQRAAPLRFHVVSKYLGTSTLDYLFRDEIVPAALAEVSKRVLLERPVAGPALFLPDGCWSYEIIDSAGTKTCFANALYPVVDTCGISELGLYHLPELFDRFEICEEGNCFTTPRGGGALDSDIVLYVKLSDISCEGAAAYASTCMFDPETQRPLAGYINVCRSWLESYVENGMMSEDTRRNLVSLMVHEILHVLYFSSWQMGNYMNPITGEAIGRSSAITTDAFGRGAVIMPHTVQKAREFYNCPLITSVPLEDGGGGGSVGSHWEKSFVGVNEVMLAQMAWLGFGAANFGPLTMALMDDTGWYKANWDAEGDQAFGKGAGCNLWSMTCENFAANAPDGRRWFCPPAESDSARCGYDHRYVGRCTSNRPFMPECSIKEADFWCTDPANNVEGSQAFSQHHGQFSRCLDASQELVWNHPFGYRDTSDWPKCFKTSCSAVGILQVHIGATTLSCPTGQEISLGGVGSFVSGSLKCPSNQQLCSGLSCPNDCYSNGVCVDGKCMCYMGYSGAECETRTCTKTSCGAGSTCNMLTGLCNNGNQPAPPPTTTQDCSPGCPFYWIGDGTCDQACNNQQCNYDGNDCKQAPPPPEPECAVGCPRQWIGDGMCDFSCMTEACLYDLGDCRPGWNHTSPPNSTHCADECRWSWIDDGVCDSSCTVMACNYDYPDCYQQGPPPPSPPPTQSPNGTAPNITHCAEECPWTWLDDDECDLTCTIAACGFDVGDCNIAASDGFPGWSGLAPNSTHCADFCPWQWIGDDECDSPCQNRACGYDHADCHADWVPAPNSTHCADYCPWTWIGDDYCDPSCSTPECDYDLSDCDSGQNVTLCSPGCPLSWVGDGECDSPACFTSACNYDEGDCDVEYCSDGCPLAWLADGECDSTCYTEECGWDAGDCADGPECSFGCPLSWVGDGICDLACKESSQCENDRGDCDCQPPGDGRRLLEGPCDDHDFCAPDCSTEWIGDGTCDLPCLVAACDYDGEDCSTSSEDEPYDEIEYCAEGCPTTWIGDGICDTACNGSQECLFDGGDCNIQSPPPPPPLPDGYCAPGCPLTWLSDGYCDGSCLNEDCNYDGSDCLASPPLPPPPPPAQSQECSSGCPTSWIGDGVCDSPACYNELCHYDGGDCGFSWETSLASSAFCGQGCLSVWINDGICDPFCSVSAACNNDGGDCTLPSPPSPLPPPAPVPECADGCPRVWLGDGFCDSECYNSFCNYDEGDCNSEPSNETDACAPECEPTLIGDGECDEECNVQSCNFDNGDCTEAPPPPKPPSPPPTKSTSPPPTNSPSPPPTNSPSPPPPKSPSPPIPREEEPSAESSSGGFGVEANVVLSGLTTATFGASERMAFKQGVSAVLAVSVDQVNITDVRDIQKLRRRALLQGGESTDTQLQVTFRVSGFESEAEASSVSQRISTAADQAAGGDGSLATELIRNGLPSNIIVSVAQPSIIVFQSQNGTGGGSNNNLLAIVLGGVGGALVIVIAVAVFLWYKRGTNSRVTPIEHAGSGPMGGGNAHRKLSPAADEDKPLLEANMTETPVPLRSPTRSNAWMQPEGGA